MRHITLSAIIIIIMSGLSLSLPAGAASTVFGDSGAQKCYESARLRSGHGGKEACGRALDSQQLSRRDRAATLVNRGILLNRQGHPEQAIDDFNAALRIAGPLPEAYLNRGNSQFLLKRIRAAVSDYSQAIRLNSRQLHVAYFNRALAFEVLGRPDDARRDYERALQIRPGFAAARARLAALPQGGGNSRPRPSAATG